MHKVILATANVKKANYAGTGVDFAAIAPNIPMALLEAYLSAKGVPVEMIDSEADGLTIEGLQDVLETMAPMLVGICAGGANPSASTMSMVGVHKFFELFNRRKETPFLTFIHGGHPTVLPERTLRETGADFVIVGEGYRAIEGLYEHISKGRLLSTIPGIAYVDDGRFVRNPSAPLEKLDELPQINWNTVNPTKYRAHNWHCFGDLGHRTPYAILWTNQGCPYPCDFCCINNVFEKRTSRFRSMERVVAEIDHLVNDHGIKHLKILDELFIIRHPRIDEFCDLLEERKYDLNMWCFARVDSVNPKILQRLKKVGLNWIAYGFESFDDDIVNATDKRLKSGTNVDDTIKMTRDAGIHICADVIAGLWEDTEATILKTRDYIFKHEFEWLNIYPAFAYPGTPLYDRYIREKIIDVPKRWDTYGLYSYECVPLPTKHLSSRRVLELRDNIFHEYYSDARTLSMVERKFGTATRQHIQDMTKVRLRRRLLEEPEQFVIPSEKRSASIAVS